MGSAPAIALVRFPTSKNATAVAAAISPALRPRPNLPVSMPATAVGKAKGRSTAASTCRRPGKSYLTSAQATTTPITTLTAAAAKATPKLSLKAARTRGSSTVAQNPLQPCSQGRAIRAASGMSTIALR